jgi:hypothetical protein
VWDCCGWAERERPPLLLWLSLLLLLLPKLVACVVAVMAAVGGLC